MLELDEVEGFAFRTGRVDCGSSHSTTDDHEFPEPTMTGDEMFAYYARTDWPGFGFTADEVSNALVPAQCCSIIHVLDGKLCPGRGTNGSPHPWFHEKGEQWLRRTLESWRRRKVQQYFFFSFINKYHHLLLFVRRWFNNQFYQLMLDSSITWDTHVRTRPKIIFFSFT